MGRIKSKLVKRASHTLLKGKNAFTEKFEGNKTLLGNSMPSKKIRNQMAGYISRLKKRELKTK